MAVMTGSRFFAETMRAWGAHVFFVPTILMKAMAEMEDLDIRRVTTHGEKAAAYMADGYARASHKIATCLAQNIGASNLAAGLRDAYMAGSPVIAITGGPDPTSRYGNPYQQVEDFSMFDCVTKFNAEVDKVDRLPDLLRQAVRAATTGSPGPVHLRLRGSHGQVLDEEDNLEKIVEERFLSYPAFRPEPEPGPLREAAKLLSRAEKPVIVAGGGVIASQAAGQVVRLAEKLSIPVATSLNGKGSIPDSHDLSVGVIGTYSRACAQKVVWEADLVFFIGSHTGSQVTNNWKIPRPGTPTIQLDINPEEIGRNYPTRVGLVGDAMATLNRLTEAVGPGLSGSEWSRRAQQAVHEWREEMTPMLNSEAVPIRPERISQEVTRFLPANAVLVADTGHSAFWTGALVDLKHPGQTYIRCAGSLGWAFPASIGVKCALPDRPVLCFTGDGGFYYHMAELETAARFGVNIVVVVNDNHSLNQEQRLINAAYGGEMRGKANEMWVFKEVNLAKIAEAMGCVGIRVERPNELAGALEKAFAAGKPAVIDVASAIDALYPRAWESS